MSQPKTLSAALRGTAWFDNYGHESAEAFESRQRAALEQALRTGALTKTHRYTREQVDSMCARYGLDPEHDFVLSQECREKEGVPCGANLSHEGAGYTLTGREAELNEKGCRTTGKTMRRIWRYQLHPHFNQSPVEMGGVNIRTEPHA